MDGALDADPERRSALNTHLNSCAGCRAEAALFHATRQALHSWEALPIDPQLTVRFAARFAAHTARHSVWTRLSEVVRPRVMWIVGAGIASVLVLSITHLLVTLPHTARYAVQYQSPPMDDAHLEQHSLSPEKADQRIDLGKHALRIAQAPNERAVATAMKPSTAIAVAFSEATTDAVNSMAELPSVSSSVKFAKTVGSAVDDRVTSVPANICPEQAVVSWLAETQ